MIRHNHHQPRLFASELFLVTARTRPELLCVLHELEQYLSRPACASLQDIAFTLSRSYDSHLECLAIVASTHPDLLKKLSYARQKLEDDSCGRIREKDGIYYFREKLGDQKLAFLFPGENAQYVNMLADLCLHFPELRQAFDEADTACARAGDGFLPSALNFPPPGAGAPAENMEDIARWEKAIALVHTANTAMMQLLDRLEVRPDAVLGHSFGELSALEMAGVLRPREDSQRLDLLCAAYLHIKDLATNSDLPQGILMTAGGADRAQVEAVISRHPEALRIAMENCPHQYVLCAAGNEMEAVILDAEEALTREGAICYRLPIARPYHTDFFMPAFQLAQAFWQKSVSVHPPQIEIYSCSSTEPYPDDPGDIIELAARHWMTPVRFREAIQKMHERGFRIFIEVGPRGNLCAFASDTLVDKPHLAVALNRPQSSGISQLLHALGLLSAHGVRLNLNYLHERWGSKVVDLKALGPSDHTRKSRMVPIPIFLPQMKADAIVAGRARPEEARTHFTKGPHTDILPSPGDPADAVMMAYLDTMNQFLAAQRGVMNSILTPRPEGSPRSSPESPGLSEVRSRSFPLLGHIVQKTPGESLVAVRTFDVTEDLYLNDHSLGTTISTTDPTLRALPVMPLLMSLEIAAEAGAALFQKKKVIAITDIRANRWIFFENGKVTLRIIARHLATDGATIEVRVDLKEEDPRAPKSLPPSSMVEATAVLADDYPAPPPSRARPLVNPVHCGWMQAAIYPKRTFHGRLFQGIRRIDRIADDGLDGSIEILPHSGLFHSNLHPELEFDPLLVDSMGQAVWVWGSKQPFLGRAYLPYKVGALRFYGDGLPPGTLLDFNLRVRARDGMGVVTDLESLDKQGNVHVLLEELADRDFQISPALHRLILEPLEETFAEVWELSVPSLPPAGLRLSFATIANFPNEVLETGYGVWRRALAFLVLCPPEREQWKALNAPLEREIQWLLGRVAAKDVVRRHLLKYDTRRFAAADILIGTDSRNKPFVAGAWRADLSLIPQLSIAHTDGMVAAACGHADSDFSLGIDTEIVRPPDPDFVAGAFSGKELALLPQGTNSTEHSEWILRAWCAKKAAGKALRTGVPWDPHDLLVAGVDRESGRVALRPPSGSSADPSRLAANDIVATTFRRNDHIFAVCALPRGAKP